MKKSLTLILATILGGCGEKPKLPGAAPAASAPVHPTIEEIVKTYKAYPTYSHIPNMKFTTCMGPVPTPWTSLSGDLATHGRQKYFLFARNIQAYLQGQQVAQPAGQVLIKETWTADQEDPRPAGLFIMAKVGGPDSDDGWIYATTAADGTVTQSGAIASCKECHWKAPVDRVYGQTKNEFLETRLDAFTAKTDHDPRILLAAADYPVYGRVDDVLRRSPLQCKIPAPAEPRKSRSTDAATHGEKFYYLHAKDTPAYAKAREAHQPLGQALVKESLVDGKPGPLFLMIKSGGIDSDAGWIYATATADGKTVTASGKIASCMKCHQDAPRDRMFGLPVAPDARVGETAREYRRFGRVDDHLRNAVLDCEPPSAAPPRKSRSGDEATHGKKLYYLYAKDIPAYLRVRDLPQPVGQAIVKESWIEGARGPLFLMIKSDEGWIYATATPDGKTVTASGQIASCVKCHQDAPHDRLFGLSTR